MHYFLKPNKPTTPTNGNPNNMSTLKTKKLALCCGINDYPGTGNDLQGCVNDAIEWSNLLKTQYGYDVTTFKNSEVTSDRVSDILEKMVKESDETTHIVFTYSGHGSNVPDKDGDEIDGRDECICLYDRFFLDDEIRTIFSKLHPQAALTYISDSCHSGSISRAFLSSINDEVYAKPKYLPSEDGANSSINYVKAGPSEENMNDVLVSGCLATEYSYDAHFDGRYMGAMSFNAINILKKNPTITYTEFHNQLKQSLPSSRYPQSPQLEGRLANKNKLMFS